MEPVQEILEGFVAELEDYRTRKLFTDDEIKAIVKKRTDIEYAVRRHTSSENDYITGVKYEQALDRLRKIRKKRRDDEKVDGPSDRACITRQHHIYQRLLRKYPARTEFWLEYIQLARKSGSGKAASRAFGRLLALNPSSPEVWIHAAAWEYEDNGNVDAARAILQRALALSPESNELWLCLFRMELKYTQKLKARHGILLGKKRKLAQAEGGEEESEEVRLQRRFVRELPLPRAIFKNAVKANPGRSGLALELLRAVPAKAQFSHLLKDIYEHLGQYKSSLEVLPVLAEHAVDDKARALGGDYSGGAESAGIAVFDTALEGSASSGLFQCYVKYVQARLKVQQERHKNREAVGLLTGALFGVFDRALAKSAEMLTSEMFREWIGLLQRIGEAQEASRIARIWTERFPTHVPAWSARIKLASRAGEVDAAVFREALQHAAAPEHQTQLHSVALDIRAAAPSSADLHAHFDVSITHCMTIGAEPGILELQYVQWCAEADPEHLTRCMDNVMKHQRLTLGVLDGFLESYREHVGLSGWKEQDYLRGVFRRASRLLGKREPLFWIRYAEFEKEVDIQKLPKVRQQAIKTLPHGTVNTFLALYSKISGIG